MIIKVLGPGCKNCKNLEKNTLDALKSSSVEAKVVNVTDIAEIQKYGVMRTPALVIDQEVVVSGRAPKEDDTAQWING